MADWNDPGGVLRQLSGRWALERQIFNQASMIGIAIFEPGSDSFVSYRECGVLKLTDGQCFDAGRDFLFKEMSNGFAVYFLETPPRLFHEILLIKDQSLWVGGASHLCRDDLYDSRYVFGSSKSFSISHRVRGPRKDYLSQTNFERL